VSGEAGDLEELADVLTSVLTSDARSRMVQGFLAGGDFGEQLQRLRSAMSAHVLLAGSERFDVSRVVRRLDQRTRKDGFRVLHAWSHAEHRFTDDVVPVLLLDFFARARGEWARERVAVEILLDAYFMHLLALCAMRAWDADEPDAMLDRITGLVDALQGEEGSGHRFVDDAETLLIYALSQFHPEEHAYDRVIDRVLTLSSTHQLAFAEVSAAVLSAHLRWGFWLMYGRDVVRMRDDNVGDYPWLLNSVLTLLRAYVASMDRGENAQERASIGVALTQGLAADPWAFKGTPPKALQPYPDAYDEARALLESHGMEVLDELEAFRPSRDVYSPLSLHFNFPHNTLVAIVTLALLEGRPQTLPLNALFHGPVETGPDEETQEGLARTLMAFSRSRPERLGYRGAMLVAYDPLSGMRSFSMTTDTLRKSLTT
jgi:hypothetical protein